MSADAEAPPINEAPMASRPAPGAGVVIAGARVFSVAMSSSTGGAEISLGPALVR